MYSTKALSKNLYNPTTSGRFCRCAQVPQCAYAAVPADRTRQDPVVNNNSDVAEIQTCDALVVGAGPAGMATALLLARRDRWKRIVVLEQGPATESEDSNKSYSFGIDWRGQQAVDAMGLTPGLEAAGMLSSTLGILYVNPDGTAKEVFFTPQKGRRPSYSIPRRAFITLLRGGLAEAEKHGRVGILHDVEVTGVQLAVRSNGGSAGGDAAGGGGAASAASAFAAEKGVGFEAATAVAAAAPPIVVHARDAASGRELRFAPRLLVGADGMRSEVRQALEAWAPGPGLSAGAFQPVVLDSPAAGLRFKSISLPPNPPFRQRDASGSSGQQNKSKQEPADSRSSGSNHRTAAAGGGQQSVVQESGDGHEAEVASVDDGRIPNRSMAWLNSVRGPPNRETWFLMFPLRDPAAPRTGTFVTRPDHHLWTLTTGPQLEAFLQESFPQLDIPSLFTEEQLQAVAASRGGAFPRPQYLRQLAAVLPPPPPPAAAMATQQQQQQQQQQQADLTPAGNAAATTTAGSAGAAASSPPGSCCGVALVGDAVHCFPPDLGQGVNAALQDSLALARALNETGDDIGQALPLYQAHRAPEAAALTQITTFGSPYQYNQDKFGRALWMANFLLRKVLSQLAPWAFSPQLMGILAQEAVSYSEMLERVHTTTRRIWALVSVVAVALLAVIVKALMSPAAAAAARAAVAS